MYLFLYFKKSCSLQKACPASWKYRLSVSEPTAQKPLLSDELAGHGERLQIVGFVIKIHNLHGFKNRGRDICWIKIKAWAQNKPGTACFKCAGAPLTDVSSTVGRNSDPIPSTSKGLLFCPEPTRTEPSGSTATICSINMKMNLQTAFSNLVFYTNLSLIKDWKIKFHSRRCALPWRSDTFLSAFEQHRWVFHLFPLQPQTCPLYLKGKPIVF